MAAEVSALYVYPIKACAGIRLHEARVARRGFEGDRRWMIVDANGKFVTQRDVPELTRVQTALVGDGIALSAPGRPPLTLPLSLERGDERQVRVWGHEGPALAHAAASAWISAYLGRPHELVYMPEQHERRVNPERALPGDIVSFADGYPFLLISEASLEDLNGRLETPITMARFRPNIVVRGVAPFAEDTFARLRLGDLTFRGAKRCDRCAVTTVDPETALRGKEPLRTLSTYRLSESKVWFGMNLIHDGLGVLREGDVLEPLEVRPAS